ncbi:MAG: hypothetical protein V7646_1403 [Pseudonocardia sp.]|jgi:hypothetical protein
MAQPPDHRELCRLAIGPAARGSSVVLMHPSGKNRGVEIREMRAFVAVAEEGAGLSVGVVPGRPVARTARRAVAEPQSQRDDTDRGGGEASQCRGDLKITLTG